jgi:hypothetical protein
MNSGGIRIGKLSLRLRGVTPQQARERGGAVAREVAQAIAGERARMAPGKTDIARISVRMPAAGAGAGIAEQIRRQMAGERPRE